MATTVGRTEASRAAARRTHLPASACSIGASDEQREIDDDRCQGQKEERPEYRQEPEDKHRPDACDGSQATSPPQRAGPSAPERQPEAEQAPSPRDPRDPAGLVVLPLGNAQPAHTVEPDQH